MKFLLPISFLRVIPVAIKMTNHFQLSLSLSLDTCPLRLRCKHSKWFLSHWFGTQTSDYFTQLSGCINYSSSTPTILCMCCILQLQDWPILHFGGETVGFSTVEQCRIWTIPQCDPILMTASSPHYQEMTQISTNSWAEKESLWRIPSVLLCGS